MSNFYHYRDLQLPEDLNNIIESDFWTFKGVYAPLLEYIRTPVKFFSQASVLVREGRAKVLINLIEYEVKAPCMVNFRPGQILQCIESSPDFHGSVVVMSKRMTDNLFMFLNNSGIFHRFSVSPVVPIEPELLGEYVKLTDDLEELMKQHDNPFYYQSLIFRMMSFFYSTAYRAFPSDMENKGSRRLADRFLNLLQANYMQERFLDFYSTKLGITSRHLTRTVKQQTGYSPAEWIDRYIILEAKVMLKSSSMTIQQIADELNFASQSAFGKYFKKNVGISPKDYRNV